MRFSLGQLVATPAALSALQDAGQTPLEFIERHQACDWGVVTADDKRANDAALESGERIFSVYRTAKNERLWVITEAVGDDGQRASTCVLTPSDY